MEKPILAAPVAKVQSVEIDKPASVETPAIVSFLNEAYPSDRSSGYVFVREQMQYNSGRIKITTQGKYCAEKLHSIIKELQTDPKTARNNYHDLAHYWNEDAMGSSSYEYASLTLDKEASDYLLDHGLIADNMPPKELPGRLGVEVQNKR